MICFTAEAAKAPHCIEDCVKGLTESALPAPSNWLCGRAGIDCQNRTGNAAGSFAQQISYRICYIFRIGEATQRASPHDLLPLCIANSVCHLSV